jgi:hypothetical protein
MCSFKPGLHGMCVARGLTPTLPIYLLLVSRSDRESSCRIHGSCEHRASTERRGQVTNGRFTPRLPVHDWRSNRFDSPTLREWQVRVDSRFRLLPRLPCSHWTWSTLTSTKRLAKVPSKPSLKIQSSYLYCLIANGARDFLSQST